MTQQMQQLRHLFPQDVPPSILASQLLAVAFVLFLAIGAVVNKRKLRQFNGPPLAGYSRIWLFWQSVNGRLARVQFAAIKKHGSVARIGPNLLITDDADIIKHMSAPGSRWTRSPWYDGVRLDPRYDTVFSTRSEKHHADLRSREIGGYNGRDIDNLESDIDSRVTDLINLMRDSYNGITMDFATIARLFTLDVLSTVAFGKKFGFMASNKDLWDYDATISSFQLALELVVNHAAIRWIFHSRLMQALAGAKVTDRTGLGPALGFARAQVAERFSATNPKVKRDMLGHFVTKGLTQLQCEVEAFLQIIAGSDSTTTTLRCCVYLLCGSPVAYAKLRAEIDAADLSYPVATYNEAQKLPYLQACLYETLRLYPPLFGLKSKLSPPEGDTIKGIFFPPNTEVGLCDDAMCRNPVIFGLDAHLFRPDRWVEASTEEKVRFKATVECVFGSGRFLCLGRHIAFIELNKGVAELIRNFDWAMADPMRGIDAHTHNVHLQSNMNLVARPRT
ncbi:hypothetical protein LTR95_013639 [Oleoguttula sp. CCFEE 5521]